MSGNQQQPMAPTIVLHGFGGQGGMPIQLPDLQALSALQNQITMAAQAQATQQQGHQHQQPVQPPPAQPQQQQPPSQQMNPPMPQPHMHAPPPHTALHPAAHAAPPPHAHAPPPHPQPHPAPMHLPPGPAPPPLDPNEVRTIFISGFPDDVKERELNNLLRFLPGYEASQLTWRQLMKTQKKQANGFALFETANYARAALAKIQNLGFDEDHHLRAEFAKKNLYVRADRPDSGPRNGGYEPFRKKHRRDDNMDNPPSTTLFIGNLSSEVDGAEIKSFFSKFKGFQNMVVNHMSKGTMCFVAYSEQADADHVYNSAQGVILESNQNRGLRIQYARNPLRKQQDEVSPKPGSTANYGATISPNVMPNLSSSSSPAVTSDQPKPQLMGPHNPPKQVTAL